MVWFWGSINFTKCLFLQKYRVDISTGGYIRMLLNIPKTHMKNLFFILISLTFVSCNDSFFTEREKEAAQSVVDFYGGTCYRSKGISSQNGNNSTYFKLKMTESEIIESFDHLDLSSSHIAYLFYNNLKEEKNNYDEVQVVIVLNDKSEHEYTFPVSTLERVNQRMIVLDKTVLLLKNQDYESIKSMLNIELIPVDKEELVPRMKEVEPQLGKIQEFQFFGFKIVTYKGVEVLHLSGALIREKQNHEFSIDIDYNSDKEELYQIQFAT